MAKLSKMEISAIANKIADDANKAKRALREEAFTKEYPVWLKTFKKTKEYRALKQYAELSKIVSEITENIPFNKVYHYNISEDLLKKLFEKSNDKAKLIFGVDRSSIERDIIIAQAKNEDLEKLITELTEKYSK